MSAPLQYRRILPSGLRTEKNSKRDVTPGAVSRTVFILFNTHLKFLKIQLFFPIFSNLRLVVTAHTYDGHPLAYVVEVQDGEQGVRDGPSHLRGGYSPGGPRAEHEAEVSSRRHQSALVWRLSLVQKLP